MPSCSGSDMPLLPAVWKAPFLNLGGGGALDSLVKWRVPGTKPNNAVLVPSSECWRHVCHPPGFPHMPTATYTPHWQEHWGPLRAPDRGFEIHSLWFSQTPHGASFCAKLGNAPLPGGHLARPESSLSSWKQPGLHPSRCPPCLFPSTLSCASDDQTFAPDLVFPCLCFAPHVCMLLTEDCLPIYSSSGPCKLVLVTDSSEPAVVGGGGRSDLSCDKNM